MGNIDFNSIMEESAAQAVSSLESASQIAALQNKRATHANNQAGAIETAAKLKASSDSVADLAMMHAKANSNKIARDFGIDTVNANGIMSQLAKAYNATSQSFYAAQAKVDEVERDSNLLANPLGWFKDLVIGDEIRADRDAIAGKRDQIAKDLDTINNLTQKETATRMALAETSNADSIRDKAEAAETLAFAQAEEARSNAAGYASVGLKVLREAGSEAFNARLDMFKLQQANLRHEDQMAMQKASLDQRKKELEKTNGKEAARTATANLVVDYRDKMGLPAASVDIVKLNMDKNSELGAIFRRQAELGLQSSDAQSLTIGTSPGDSYMNAVEFGADLESHVGTEQYDRLQEAQRMVNEAAASIGGQGGTEAAANAANWGLNKQSVKTRAGIAQALSAAHGELQAKADLNFASKPLDVDGMLATAPGLAHTRVFQQVISPTMEATEADITLDKILSGAAELYASGELTSSEAAKELRAIVRLAVDQENAAGDRLIMGAKPLNNKKLEVVVSQGKVLPSVSFGMPTLPERPGSKTEAAKLGAATVAKGVIPGLHFAKLGKTDKRIKVDLLNPTGIATYLAAYRTTKLASDLELARTKQD